MKNIELKSEISLSTMDLHSDTHWRFMIFATGIYTNQINGTIHRVTEGFLVITGPNHVQRITAVTPAHICHEVRVSDEKLQHICLTYFSIVLYERLCDPNEPVVLRLPYSTSQEVQQTIARVSYMTRERAEISDMCIQSIVTYLLGQVIVNEETRYHNSDFFAQLLLLQQPTMFCLSSSDIIKKSGYSRSQYLRKFKKETGVTLTKYLMNLRINYAKSLLQTTSKSILEISIEVGYDSVNYFIRIFRENTGVTPLQFRHQNQQYKE